jgi:D-alanyl-D-alanine carboxypeptidase/D-alanyl-D-alanine-endopeptidase (penicillin-binding protein 4)
VKRTSTLTLAICALLAILVLCTPEPAGALTPSCETMRARLLRGGGGASGLLVVDAETGKRLCARAPSRPRPLASNMKLFTTATALARLGPEERIETTLVTDGFIDLRGTVHGSLYLVGAGDPALATPAFSERFLGGLGTNLFLLKRQLRESGIDRVTGRLYADDDVFDRLRGVADSGYATSSYIGPLSGLSLNAGYSSASGGSFAADPARTAAATLARALRGAGIEIAAQVALGDAPASGRVLASVESPTIDQIANVTDVYSHNFFAEMLIKLLGARLGSGGSTAAGAAVVERFARSRGSGLRAIDGSGLTRGNRATPAQIVALLDSMRDEPTGDEFIQDLALTGREGTVLGRMRGTAAYGRCRTKTGTLTGVSNLSGYCFNRSGRVVLFSVLMASVGDLGLAHLEQDRIAGEVASY